MHSENHCKIALAKQRLYGFPSEKDSASELQIIPDGWWFAAVLPGMYEILSV